MTHPLILLAHLGCIRMSNGGCPKLNRKRRTLTQSIKKSIIASEILRGLTSGSHQAKVAKDLNVSKSLVNYWTTKLEAIGFLRRKQSRTTSMEGPQRTKQRGTIILYEITIEGSKLLDWYDAGSVWPKFRLHNVVFGYPVIVHPQIAVDWKRVEMRNWVQYTTKISGIRVRLNSGKSLEVTPLPVFGYCPWEILVESSRSADGLARHLEERFQMQLGLSFISRRPHFGVYDPVANEYTKHFELSTEAGRMDRSEDFGEIDYYSPEAAAEYIRMPKRVKRIEALLSAQQKVPRWYQYNIPEVLH
jgi:hypothetical protein